MDPQFKQEVEQLQALRLARGLHVATGLAQGYVELRGRRVLDLCSFDYLELASHPRVKRDVLALVEANGIGACSPRLSSGSREQHASCEFRLASFFCMETALLFSSRAQATLSLFSNILTEHDAVFFDEAAHSVVGDAAYLLQAQSYHYRTEEPQSLAVELERAKNARRKIVFVETLSPFHGRDCALERIIEIAQRGLASVVLDESFAVGALGLRGAGVGERLVSRDPIIAIISDLSLGIGAYGGSVAMSRSLRDLLVSRSKMFTAEASIPASLARAVETSIDVLELMPIERELLSARASRLRAGIKELGLARDADGSSPIVSIVFDKRAIAQEFAEALFQKGFLCDFVPRGTLLSEATSVRFVIRSALPEHAVEQLLQAISDIRPRLKT